MLPKRAARPPAPAPGVPAGFFPPLFLELVRRLVDATIPETATPAFGENSPRLVFDRLFRRGAGKAGASDAGILDAVLEQSAHLIAARHGNPHPGQRRPRARGCIASARRKFRSAARQW